MTKARTTICVDRAFVVRVGSPVVPGTEDHRGAGQSL